MLVVKYEVCKYVNMYNVWLLMDPGKMDGNILFSQIVEQSFAYLKFECVIPGYMVDIRIYRESQYYVKV